MTSNDELGVNRRDFLWATLASIGAVANSDSVLAETAGTPGQVFSGATSAENWVPFKFMQDGAEHAYGEMVLFRSTGSAGNGLAVRLWRAPDGDTPIYTSEAGDETFLVLNGEATIEFLDLSESKTFKVGDVCAWSQHSRTRWQLRNGFKKFFVVAKATA
jgi:uncharacterized cupin superfamily protein